MMVLIALLADVLAPYSPYEQYRAHVLTPPVWNDAGTWAFPLGTDEVGRDILSRLIYGARISLFIGLSVMIASVLVGVVLGLFAAFRGGAVDALMMRLMDLIMSIPDLVLAVVIVAIIGPSLVNTIIAILIVFLPKYVRLVRASALSELSKDYVVAAKVAGVGPLRLMFVTVLPNCMAPLIVQATLGVSDALLAAAALGFLGLGAQPPTPEWGSMLSSAREFLQRAPWVVTLPGRRDPHHRRCDQPVRRRPARRSRPPPQARLARSSSHRLTDALRCPSSRSQPHRRVPGPPRTVPGRRRGFADPRSGRDRLDRRRVRLGQIGRHARCHGPSAEDGEGQRRPHGL